MESQLRVDPRLTNITFEYDSAVTFGSWSSRDNESWLVSFNRYKQVDAISSFQIVFSFWGQKQTETTISHWLPVASWQQNETGRIESEWASWEGHIGELYQPNRISGSDSTIKLYKSNWLKFFKRDVLIKEGSGQPTTITETQTWYQIL